MYRDLLNRDYVQLWEKEIDGIVSSTYPKITRSVFWTVGIGTKKLIVSTIVFIKWKY